MTENADPLQVDAPFGALLSLTVCRLLCGHLVALVHAILVEKPAGTLAVRQPPLLYRPSHGVLLNHDWPLLTNSIDPVD